MTREDEGASETEIAAELALPISRTSLAVEIFFVQVAPSNQKWAASSIVHWIGTSISEVPSRRYGFRSSMKLEE